MNRTAIFTTILTLPFLWGCGNGTVESDAYGHFESDEIIVSSEATGKLLTFAADEGATLDSGETVASVDVHQIELQRAQVEARIQAVYAKQVDPTPENAVVRQQIEVLDDQLAGLEQQVANLEVERIRTENLMRENAATEQQLTQITGQIAVLTEQVNAQNEQKSVLLRQIAAQNARIGTQNRGLLAEVEPLRKQLELLDDQIAKAEVKNPVNGTVLVNYAKPGEVTAFGKPLYKIADLSQLYLRAYITGDQLANVRIGQSVTVRYDGTDESIAETSGTVTYVSGEAEFTPKTVQTRANRTNLVYAIRIRVPNSDGILKIGMPGEVVFSGGGEQ